MTAPYPVFVPAYAKINLTLDVLGRREDGYHSLASVMQTVALHDTFCMRASEPGTISCTCDVAGLQGPDNLALRAAQLLLAQTTDHQRGVSLELHKDIPMQAGLGGGSSDAATVLTSLNVLWKLGLDSSRLEALAAQLGSDVPFFVHGGTALIQGRGEIVIPLPDAEPLWLVLTKPAINVPTPQVFRGLTPADYTGDEQTAAVVAAIRHHEPVPFDHLTNALEPSVMRAFPQVTETREALLSAGAPLVRLSGSGPTLYAPFRTLWEAVAVYHRARELGMLVWLSHTVTSGEVSCSLPPGSMVRYTK